MQSIAIIDIGSNSVRLVIYESLARAPVPLFNERVLCGLGRHVASRGELESQAMERAFTALRRYYLLARQNGAKIYAFATAAVREAKNGGEFVKVAQDILKVDLQVLSGRQEAYYAALGIVCGFRVPNGLAADLGGGSLEFTKVAGEPVGEGITLPLGGLRLQDEYGKNYERLREVIDKSLKSNDIVLRARGGVFYAVGGTWRSLAALHMHQIDYPFRIMHHYELYANTVRSLCEYILETDIEKIRCIENISSARRSMLPYGALLLERILNVMAPSQIIFSAFGVREGYLYSLMGEKTKSKDPLLESVYSLSKRYARSDEHSFELDIFTKNAFEVFGIKNSKGQERLRQVACLVADIAWRSSPDYRAGQALNFLLHANFVGIDHYERSFISLACYFRHKGAKGGKSIKSLCELAGEENLFRARVLGELFRLSFLFSSGKEGILKDLIFELKEKKITLKIPKNLKNFQGESIQRRQKALSKLLKKDIEIKVGG